VEVTKLIRVANRKEATGAFCPGPHLVRGPIATLPIQI